MNEKHHFKLRNPRYNYKKKKKKVIIRAKVKDVKRGKGYDMIIIIYSAHSSIIFLVMVAIPYEMIHGLANLDPIISFQIFHYSVLFVTTLQ